MGGKSQRKIAGRDRQDAAGNGQWGHAYVGEQQGPDEAFADIGIGLYNGEKFDLLQANGQAGVFAQNGGSQLGLKGEATVGSLQGGLLGDLASLVGIETNGEEQGGWENFFGYEVHGPTAKAEAHAGTAGIQAGAGVDWFGGTGTVGGAEYDWLGGSELSIGGGVPATPGASGGLHWSDDDGDGLTEWGFNVGGDAAAGVGLGVSVGFKTELPGHIYNAGAAALDWMTGGGDD